MEQKELKAKEIVKKVNKYVNLNIILTVVFLLNFMLEFPLIFPIIIFVFLLKKCNKKKWEPIYGKNASSLIVGIIFLFHAGWAYVNIGSYRERLARSSYSNMWVVLLIASIFFFFMFIFSLYVVKEGKKLLQIFYGKTKVSKEDEPILNYEEVKEMALKEIEFEPKKEVQMNALAEANEIYDKYQKNNRLMKTESHKFRFGIMISLCIFYGLLFILSLIVILTIAFDNLYMSIGIAPIDGEPYSVVIGMLWIAMLPTLGLYFATISPFNFKKKTRGILFVGSILGMFILDVVFFIVFKDYKEILDLSSESLSDAVLIPISLFVGQIGFIICYGLTLFTVNPNALHTIRIEKNGSGSIITTLKNALLSLFNLLIKLLRNTLILKENHPSIFIWIISFFFTVLLFPLVYVILVFVVLVVILVLALFFGRFVSFAYTSSSYRNSTYKIYDDGYERTLEYYDYYNGHDRYKDDIGNYWYSDDNGSTFYKE